MSAASSGGVSSSVAWMAVMISASGEAIAWRTSSEVRMISRGSPDARSRPRIEVSISSYERDRGPGGELDRLRALRADRHPVLEPDVVGDRVVEVVAAHPQRAGDDQAAERDHGDLRSAAADVDDHAPDGLADVDPGADRGRQGLLDQVHLARTRAQRGLLDRPPLDLRDPRRRADDHPRAREARCCITLRRNWASIASVTSKSAITP